MIYIASPYNGKDPCYAEARMHDFTKTVAELVERGVHVVSPMFFPMIQKYGAELPSTKYDFWKDYCRDLLQRCDAMLVVGVGLRPNGLLTREQWLLSQAKEIGSQGLAAEIVMAGEMHKPILTTIQEAEEYETYDKSYWR
jgi:hypothetical protein